VAVRYIAKIYIFRQNNLELQTWPFVGIL